MTDKSEADHETTPPSAMPHNETQDSRMTSLALEQWPGCTEGLPCTALTPLGTLKDSIGVVLI